MGPVSPHPVTRNSGSRGVGSELAGPAQERRRSRLRTRTKKEKMKTLGSCSCSKLKKKVKEYIVK